MGERNGYGRVALTVLLILAWGSTFAAVKIGVESAPPILFAGLRSVIGGAVMTVLAAAIGGPPRLRAHLGGYALLTVLNVVAFFGLQTLAILALPSGLAAVLIYLQPVLTGVLASPLLGEALTGAKTLGLLLGFAGIVLVSAGALGGVVGGDIGGVVGGDTSGQVSGVGIVYAVASAMLWSFGTIAFKHLSDQADPIQGWWAVAVPFVVGGAVLTVTGGLTEGWSVHWSGRFLAALAFAALIGSAMSWTLWFWLVDSGEASRAATYIFFVPLVSVTIGALLLGERLAPTLLAGAALVALGVYLANRTPRRRGRTQSSPVP